MKQCDKWDEISSEHENGSMIYAYLCLIPKNIIKTVIFNVEIIF